MSDENEFNARGEASPESDAPTDPGGSDEPVARANASEGAGEHETHTDDSSATDVSGSPWGYGQQRDRPTFHSPGYPAGPGFGAPTQGPVYPGVTPNESTAVGGPPPPGGPPWPTAEGYTPGGGDGRGRRGGGTAVLVIVVALIAALIGGGIGGYVGHRSSSSTDSNYSLGKAPSGTTKRSSNSVAGVARRVTPGVVQIQVSSAGQGDEGSGFLVKGGYIVTNNHVVSSAGQRGKVEVDFSDGKSTAATIVGHDSTYDIAVLKPKTTDDKPALPLGNSDDAVVGDPVIAVGSPLGLAGTVTSGIISAKNRAVAAGSQTGTQQSYLNALQTDAAINPGNSGGPLVNSKGQVIGVNSAIKSTSNGLSSSQEGGSIGLGFAIPVNQARRVAEQIVKTGHATHPVIGAEIDLSYTGGGARIARNNANHPGIVPNGPADKAGLKPGDVITELDNKKITSADQLIVSIRSHKPGDKVKITYRRNGSTHTVQLTLKAQ